MDSPRAVRSLATTAPPDRSSSLRRSPRDFDKPRTHRRVFRARGHFRGAARVRHVRASVRWFPERCAGRGIHGAAVDGIRRSMRALAELALFHARDCAYVCAHADWSVFSGPVLPAPLCTRYVVSHPLRTGRHFRRRSLARLVNRCATEGRTSVTIAPLYGYVNWEQRTMLHPSPCARISYQVFPHFLLSDCRHVRNVSVVGHDRLGASSPARVVPPSA